MIELLQTLMIWWACHAGAPVNGWYQYAIEHNFDYGNVTAQVRIATDDGPIWLWEFDTGLIYLTRPSSDHLQCVRVLND